MSKPSDDLTPLQQKYIATYIQRFYLETQTSCPGADESHPHHLQIIDETTGNLFCMASFKEWQCPFLYKDKHKMDYWKHGYDNVSRRWSND